MFLFFEKKICKIKSENSFFFETKIFFVCNKLFKNIYNLLKKIIVSVSLHIYKLS